MSEKIAVFGGCPEGEIILPTLLPLIEGYINISHTSADQTAKTLLHLARIHTDSPSGKLEELPGRGFGHQSRSLGARQPNPLEDLLGLDAPGLECLAPRPITDQPAAVPEVQGDAALSGSLEGVQGDSRASSKGNRDGHTVGLLEH